MRINEKIIANKIIIECDRPVALIFQSALMKHAARYAKQAYDTALFITESRETILEKANKLYALAQQLDEVIEDSKYNNDEDLKCPSLFFWSDCESE